MYHLRMKFIPRIVLSLIVVMMLSACGTLSRKAIPLSTNTHFIDVPKIQQTNPAECGLATTSILTGYYGRAYDPKVIEAMKVEAVETKAISAMTLQNSLEESGYEVHIFKGKIDATTTGLYHHIDRGRPLVVMIAKNGAKLDLTHYVLVTGYDPDTNQIVLQDPQFGQQVWAESEFQKIWERTKFFTLLATPVKNKKTSKSNNQRSEDAQN